MVSLLESWCISNLWEQVKHQLIHHAWSLDCDRKEDRCEFLAGAYTALPEDVTSSQSEYTFRRQLETWLFNKSFPDIIIWYWLHLDF